jgi:hypothetical protein
MCHFALYIHPCGDSYYLKYSSCSYDRFAHHPESALNPLHPLTQPDLHKVAEASSSSPENTSSTASPTPTSSTSTSSTSSTSASSTSISVSDIVESRPGAVSDLSRPQGGGEQGKCYVFEVVLQKREEKDCPTCRRSERRRNLPAKSRGIFAPS